MKEQLAGKELNRIEKRAIEALAIAPVIRAVSQKIGRDEALAILMEVNQREAFVVDTATKNVSVSCCRDEPFARGFNQNLRLVRTKTIMEGAEHCDFRYYLDDKGLR